MIKLIRKKTFWLPIILMLIALVSLTWKLGSHALVDYDEATYAQVVHDTLQSGNIWTLQKSGANWFEKPPLYFWTAMISVKALGENEFALRLPSVIFGLLTLLLVYFIAKKLTASYLLAAAVFLILLYSPFYYFAREVRLDSGVIMSIMLAVYLLIIGWEKDKKLFWLFPALAVGFLFKSVIVILALPILLIYSSIYRQWNWLKSKYLWWGVFPAMVIILPWHLYQQLKYGLIFWQQYLGYHVVQRAVGGIGTEAQNNGISWNYFYDLWNYFQPFTQIFLIVLIVYVIFTLSRRRQNRNISSSLFSAILIIILFSFFKTHIITYLLPMLPFAALALAGMVVAIFSFGPWLAYGIILLITAAQIFYGNIDRLTILPYHEDQKAAAAVYSKIGKAAPLYVLEWPAEEAVRYYSQDNPNFVYFPTEQDSVLKGPLYLMVNTAYLNYFRNQDGTVKSEYQDWSVFYQGKYLWLLYSATSVTLQKGFTDGTIYLVQ